MKKVILSLTFLFAFASLAMAQQNEFEYLKSQYQNDRKTLLMNYLKLSDADAATFWPIYQNYESERSDLANKRFTNLKNYADQYSTLTNDQAEVFVKNYFDNAAKQAAIQKKYASQFKKAVGAKTTLAWLQFEAYVDASMQSELLGNIPFVGKR